MTISQISLTTEFKPLSTIMKSIFLTGLSFIVFSTISEAAVVDTPVSSVPASGPNDNNASVSNPVTNTTTTVNTTPAKPIDPLKPTENTPPLNQPIMSEEVLLNWATDAARLAYSYDFKNYPQQMQQSQKNFTGPGWTAFTTALNKSNNLKVVETKKLVASATPNGKATVIKEGLRNGLYTWKVQIPMLATYESESKLIKQNLLINMLITRTTSPTGIGISHFVAVVVPATQPITTPTPSPTSSVGPVNTASSSNGPATIQGPVDTTSTLGGTMTGTTKQTHVITPADTSPSPAVNDTGIGATSGAATPTMPVTSGSATTPAMGQ